MRREGIWEGGLAAAIADELGVEFSAVAPETLTYRLDLTGVLSNVIPGQVLVISELEELRQLILDDLHHVLEELQVEILIGAGPGARKHTIPIPSFTFIGTTSKPWLVDEHIRRWCIPCEFSPYSSDEMAQIVSQIATEKGLSVDPEAAFDIAALCGCRPGEAAMLLRKIENHFRLAPSDTIDRSRLREITDFLGSGNLYPKLLSVAERLQTMTGIEFEHWVADLFRQAGFGVELTQVTGDHGVDLWATLGADLVAVQCKRWEGTVGEPVIRDLYGAMTAANAKAGCLVTTATFTPQAQQFAQNKTLSLVDLDKLMEAARLPSVLRDMLIPK